MVLKSDMIREAHKLDMLTCPYVFEPEQAKAMAEAGADILVSTYGIDNKRFYRSRNSINIR